jgi:transaldolase/glucose-6-phosphate isomerase
VQELIGPETVNTMPPATMDAFRDHGHPRATLEEGIDQAHETVKRLASVGIDLIEVGEELQKEGVDLFAKSFDALRAVIRGRREAIIEGAHDKQIISASGYEKQIQATYQELDKADFPSRLWRKDPTLWKKDPAHQQIITNALGWLTVPEVMVERVPELVAFADEVKRAGFRDVVLLGMGGSSLAPELFRQTFPSAPGFPKLHVLDSTVPDGIKALERNIDITRTIFIVSSKSGETLETLAHYRHFFDHVKSHSSLPPGAHFVAITDPGTKLEKIGKENKFRRVFLNCPDIGGRYSALSYFGLVPAALTGVDEERLLDCGIRMMHSSAGCIRVDQNVGVSLGAAIGTLQKARRDKITFIVSPPIKSFGLWVEQLIAESTGKEDTGLIPVCDEPLVDPRRYGTDRVFVYLKLRGGADAAQDSAFDAISKAGFPTILISVADRIDIGEEFMRWEIATATAGAVLGINPFDQPNVQESKDNTTRLLAEYEKNPNKPGEPPLTVKGKLALHAGGAASGPLKNKNDFRDALRTFLNLARAGDYLATLAYVPPNPTVEKEIAAIRRATIDRFAIATTFGYGPRYLHSTGQLHKGGPNSGLFILITQDSNQVIPIPGAAYDFGRLCLSQSLGDFQALGAHGRRVIQVHLHGEDPIGELERLRKEIVEALAA